MIERKKQVKDIVDTTTLEKGDEIKNYKELCSVLNIKEKTGASKISQMKEIQRFIKLEKVGYGFIIKEKYQSPLERQDERNSGNNSIYLAPFKLILLNYLANRRTTKDQFETIELTTNQILKATAMVNSNYAEKEFENWIIKNHSEITQTDINEFYKVARPRFYDNVKTMLDRIEDDSTIVVEREYKIRVFGEWITASKKESEMITKVHRMVMDKMISNLTHVPIERMSQIYSEHRQIEFFRLVDAEIKEKYSSHGWDKVFMIYSFGFSNTLDENIERYKRELDEIKTQKQYINQISKDRLELAIAKKHWKELGLLPSPQIDCDKLKEEIIDNDEEEDAATNFVMTDEYLEKQKKISKLLIEIRQ